MAEKWVSPNQQRRLARIPEDKRDDLRAGIGSLAEFTAGMTPGLGDALTAKEAYDAAREGNYGTSALLATLAAIGLVPGAGDAASAAGKTALDSFLARSAVRTEKGDPLRVYTGTSADADFDAFRVPKRGTWFSKDPEAASLYALDNESMGFTRDGHKLTPKNTASRVIPAYLDIQNPFMMTDEVFNNRLQVPGYKAAQARLFDELRAKGHDGVVFPDGTYVVLKSPSQIKSAIGNQGTYDPTSRIMTRASGGPIEVNDRDPAKRRRLI
jgi:hypothetical protein